MKEVYLETYGCSLNQADSQRIKGILLREGFEFTEDPDSADYIIVNTCAVKHQTEQRILHRIKELEEKDGELVVCGCLPKINLEAVEKVTDAPLVDTNSLEKVPEAIETGRNYFSDQHENKLMLPCPDEGLVATVPVAEGCIGNCAFCGTKNARRNVESYPVEDVLEACRTALEKGAREIRLTAEDTGCYGVDIGRDLIDLLEQVADLDYDFKARIGMMNPSKAFEFKSELLELLSNDNFFNFLHIPVQSGSEKVLESMKRSHGVKEYREVAEGFREEFPHGSLSTDVIVGFPGESEEDFEKTMDLVRSTRPDIVNVSKFFPRPDTEAAGMEKIPTETISERSKRLAELSNEISEERNQSMVGENFYTYLLSEADEEGFFGRSPGYKKVLVDSGSLGEKIKVEVVSASQAGLKAEKF